MLRKAKNMAYGEVLKMETNVSLNKINDSDFEMGVKNVLMTPKEQQSYPGFKRDFSDSEV